MQFTRYFGDFRQFCAIIKTGENLTSWGFIKYELQSNWA